MSVLHLIIIGDLGRTVNLPSSDMDASRVRVGAPASEAIVAPNSSIELWVELFRGLEREEKRDGQNVKSNRIFNLF